MPMNFTIVTKGKTNDEADDTGDIGEAAVTGWLHFVAQLPEGMPALAPDVGDEGTDYWIGTFKAYLDSDGVLKNEPGGTAGVQIWDNDPAFNLDRLPYLVYAPEPGLRANGKRVPFTPFVFNAPGTGDVVKFSELQPVPSATAEGISRGFRGYTPWFVPIPDTDPQQYQAMDPDGPVGPPIGLGIRVLADSISRVQLAPEVRDSLDLADAAEQTANKGQVNGYASLNGSGLVPSSQLPSYVDAVVAYANLAAFPGTGATDTIYVATDTGFSYRWSGAAYFRTGDDPGRAIVMAIALG